MPLYDVTLPLCEGMMVFPGDPPFTMSPAFRTTRGDDFNLSVFTMNTHTGTHIDPPAHYLDGGPTVDLISPEVLIGPGMVLDLRGKARIDRKALESFGPPDYTRVFFKTDNGPRLLEPEFYEDYVHLTEDGSAFLIDVGVRMVGIDYLSIESFDSPGAPVHRALLKAGIVVVEGLNLMDVPPGPCRIYCLPLKILGGDGAPARVIIETER
jgi:arylformamidase